MSKTQDSLADVWSLISYPMQKSPEHRHGVFAIILLYNVGEAQQGDLFPAAPHGRTVDQRILGQ